MWRMATISKYSPRQQIGVGNDERQRADTGENERQHCDIHHKNDKGKLQRGLDGAKTGKRHALVVAGVVLGLNPPGNVIEIEAGEDGGDRRHHEKEGHQQHKPAPMAVKVSAQGQGMAVR